MTKTPCVAALIVVALAMWLTTASGCLANARAELPSLWNGTFTHSRAEALRQRRQDTSFCVGLSMLPPAWLIAPFVMGFYQDGFLPPWEAWRADAPDLPRARTP